MYCMYCGHEICVDAKFCPLCGRRQERPAAAAQAPGDSGAARSSAAPRGQAASQRAAGTVVVRPAPATVQAPAATQAMPRPSAAAYVPAAVPGRGPSASAAGQPHVGSPYRHASASRAAGSPGSRAGAVIAVVLAAFVVLAGGVLVFGRLGPSTTSSSEADATATQTQGTASATTSTNTTKAEPESDAKGADAQKEIELDGLTTSGDSITYVNPEYGYTVTLPSSFKAVAASGGGEGASFEDESSGIRVDVSADRNDSGATVESVLAEYTSAYDVSYQASGSSWLVASWEDGAGDYYAKQYVGPNYVTRIQYSTPTASHETGSQLIEDTINDFKPGAV